MSAEAAAPTASAAKRHGGKQPLDDVMLAKVRVDLLAGGELLRHIDQAERGRS